VILVWCRTKGNNNTIGDAVVEVADDGRQEVGGVVGANAATVGNNNQSPAYRDGLSLLIVPSYYIRG
jgi:hypothetical protein